MELVAAYKTYTGAWVTRVSGLKVTCFMDRSVLTPINDGVFEVTHKAIDKRGNPVWFLEPVAEDNYSVLWWLQDKATSCNEWESNRIFAAIAEGRLSEPSSEIGSEQNFLLWAAKHGAETLHQIIVTPLHTYDPSFTVSEELTKSYYDGFALTHPVVMIRLTNGESEFISASDLYMRREDCTNAIITKSGNTIHNIRVNVTPK